MESKRSSKKLHYIKILLPTFITISLFITALFVIIIPRFENIIIDRKREMIRELTSTTVSMIDKWHRLELAGEVSKSEAQESAINQIKSLRYGSEQKDYFWITDTQPKMIVHPYRPDLDGKDLNTFEDLHHKKLFVEMVNVVKQQGDGFVDYTWQWKDDSTNIVPKLSYVKGFKPWDWVIGTGIYIEDVHEEIALLEQKILTISIVISILSALLLLYIAFQNLRSEKLRQNAENELRESREKYKMLVETSGEGIIMILENQQTFINKTLYSLLGYNEISQPLGLDDIFVNYPESKIFDFLSFKKINDDPTVVEQFETQFKKYNGDLLNVLLIISPISLMNNNGIILGVKDISLNKEIKEELDYSREKYLTLTNQLTIGVFRTTPDKNLLFKEVNPAAVNLLGAQTMEQLLSTSLLKFFEHSGDEESFISDLLENKFLKNRIVQFKNLNGKKLIVALSAVVVKNSADNYLSVDGIIEDITEKKKTDKEKEDLISDLQTSVLMLNQNIQHFVKEIPSCDYNATVTEVVKLMTDSNSSVIIVTGSNNEEMGIVTDSDIRERVVFTNANINSAIYSFMTSPVASLPVTSTIYDALIKLKEYKLSQLLVKNNNITVGVLFAEDLFNASYSNYLFFLNNIEQSDSIKKIKEYRNQLILLIKGLIESDSGVRSSTKMISLISDVISKRIIQLAVERLGNPPVNFAFITMGSEGREEQTLYTDQDNAIIYEDVDSGNEEIVKDYFAKLGEIVSGNLNTVGYSFCKGNIMASNTKWCQPLSVWQKYFTDWITSASPQNLLDIKIFFDFRNVYGDDTLSTKLKKHVDKVTGSFNLFFVYLSESLLQSEIPENMQKIKSPIDTKLVLLPLVDFARMYSLKNQLNTTNTIERFEQLLEKEAISKPMYKNILYSYNFLMELRLKNQVEKLFNGENVDNIINQQNLTEMDIVILKKIYGLLDELKNKIRLDFKGSLVR
jgi:PAS domain S-box-containing protein